MPRAISFRNALLGMMVGVALAATACNSLPVNSKMSATGPTGSSGTQIFTAPAELCAIKEPTPEPDPQELIVTDNAPLRLEATAKGISLDARGATAGRVLAVLGQSTQKRIKIDGWGARVRIWAHVTDWPAYKVLAGVTTASGLVIAEWGTGQSEDHHHEDFTLQDDAASTWEKLERLYIIDLSSRQAWLDDRYGVHWDPARLEVAYIPVGDPVQVGSVLARTVLHCRGRIVASPERSLLFVETFPENLNRIKEVIDALERKPSVEIRHDNHQRGEPPHPISRVFCGGVDKPSAPNLPDSQLFSGGGASGDLLRNVALQSRRDMIAGCGADRPVHISSRAGDTLLEVANQLGMVAIPYPPNDVELMRNIFEPGTVFEAGAQWSAMALNERERNLPESPYSQRHLRSFQTLAPSEFARAVEPFTFNAYVAAYEPAGTILVWASEIDLPKITALLGAWNPPMGGKEKESRRRNLNLVGPQGTQAK